MKKKRTKERKKKERKIEQNMDSKNENGERKKKHAIIISRNP